MNEREANKEIRYKEILMAGLELMVQNGYSAFKIRDLANRLNISVGLFFHYFKSKEDLYMTLVRIGLSGPTDLVSKHLAEANPLSVFTDMAERIMETIAKDQFTAKMFLLMHQTTIGGDVPESVKELFTGFDIVGPLIPIVDEGQKQGVIKAGDPTSLILTFWAAINGIAEAYVRGACPILPKGEWISDILRNN